MFGGGGGVECNLQIYTSNVMVRGVKELVFCMDVVPACWHARARDLVALGC